MGSFILPTFIPCLAAAELRRGQSLAAVGFAKGLETCCAVATCECVIIDFVIRLLLRKSACRKLLHTIFYFLLHVYYVMLHYVVLYCAILSYLVLCYGLLWYVLLCNNSYIMLCKFHGFLFYFTMWLHDLIFFVFSYITLCCLILYCNISPYFLLSFVYYIMYYVVLCRLTTHYLKCLTSCYIVLHHIFL